MQYFKKITTTIREKICTTVNKRLLNQPNHYFWCDETSSYQGPLNPTQKKIYTAISQLGKVSAFYWGSQNEIRVMFRRNASKHTYIYSGKFSTNSDTGKTIVTLETHSFGKGFQDSETLTLYC